MADLLPSTLTQWLLTIWIPILLVAGHVTSDIMRFDARVSISARGEKSPASHGTGVSFRWNSGEAVNALPAGWAENQGVISVSAGSGPRPLPFIWSGTIDHSSRLELIQNDQSGVVDISVGGKTTSFDLYSPHPRTLTVRLAPMMPIWRVISSRQFLLLGMQLALALLVSCFAVPAAGRLLGGATESASSISKNVGYISRLDHLRFVAALLVLVYHVTFDHVPQEITSNNPLLALVFEGHTGVSLFMVLSGFIFGTIGKGREISYLAFVASRVVRIFPLYIFAVFLAVSTQRWNYAPADIALLMFPIFDAYRLNSLPWFGQLWTIGVEFQFYAIFPFVNKFSNTSGVRYLVKLLFLSIALKWLYMVMSGDTRDFGYFTILGRIDQFLIGMLASHFYMARKRAFANPIFMILSICAVIGSIYRFHAAGGFVGTGNSPVWVFWPVIEAVCWAFLCVAYLSSSIKIPSVLDRTLSYFGAISFSIYVMQYIALIPFYSYIDIIPVTGHYLRNVIGSAIFLAVPAVLMLASVTYELVEKPFFVFKTRYVKEADRCDVRVDGGHVESESSKAIEAESVIPDAAAR
ncbi:acyltransferase family protein [Burkholderia ubonensis]|uniref:acyltransferase family protein n=1 Tax=Burkholderia ubonensis TaxID=101571 RepID=UPI0012FA086E|nr:acyltransferase [Burkholderia ubonensis]